MTPLRSALSLVAATCFVVTSPTSGQSLSDLAFLAGCWRGPLDGGGAMEEYYSTPSENLIVGTTRYLRRGQASSFEFTTITVQNGMIELLPYPNGRPSADAFRLTRLDAAGAVFEAPQHDFPKRIIYRIESDGGRVARIDGGKGSDQVSEWRLRPVACR
jgi:hypothetical protein